MDIFVGSLPFKLTEKQLRELFEQYGEVTSVKIIIDKITRQNKGFGFVEMPNDTEAKTAIDELDGFEVLGRNIVVNKSEKKVKVEKSGFSRGNEKRNNFSKGGFKKDSFGKGGGKNDKKGGGKFKY